MGSNVVADDSRPVATVGNGKYHYYSKTKAHLKDLSDDSSMLQLCLAQLGYTQSLCNHPKVKKTTKPTKGGQRKEYKWRNSCSQEDKACIYIKQLNCISAFCFCILNLLLSIIYNAASVSLFFFLSLFTIARFRRKILTIKS